MKMSHNGTQVKVEKKVPKYVTVKLAISNIS